MKNADMPASQVPLALLYESRLDGNSWERAALGLTKRELFSAMAMQGILAGSHPVCRHPDCEKMAAGAAVAAADALLAALEPKP